MEERRKETQLAEKDKKYDKKEHKKERKKIWFKSKEVTQMWLHAGLFRLINTAHNAFMQPSCDWFHIRSHAE
jgi:hypothetical protein